MTGRQPEYLAGEVERALAADSRTHELGVRAEVSGNTVVIRGEVAGERRRRLIEEVAAEVVPPGMALRNEVSVLSVRPPAAESSAPESPAPESPAPESPATESPAEERP